MKSRVRKDVIVSVLRDNPDKWMSAHEIASLCYGGRWVTPWDVSGTIRAENLPIETRNISPNTHPSLVYRYKPMDTAAGTTSATGTTIAGGVLE